MDYLFWNSILISSIVVAAFFILLLVFYYYMTYRSLKKQRDNILEFQTRLEPGKKVLCAGGIFAEIIKIEGAYVDVAISKGNVIKVSLYSISEIID